MSADLFYVKTKQRFPDTLFLSQSFKMRLFISEHF